MLPFMYGKNYSAFFLQSETRACLQSPSINPHAFPCNVQHYWQNANYLLNLSVAIFMTGLLIEQLKQQIS